jgi:hypothetical protein
MRPIKLQFELTTENVDIIVNALEDHVDKLRHNEDDIIGQLYDGDQTVTDTAVVLYERLRQAVQGS